MRSLVTDSQCSNPGAELAPSLKSYPTGKTKQADDKLKSLLGPKVQITATDEVPEIISMLFMFHLFGRSLLSSFFLWEKEKTRQR